MPSTTSPNIWISRRYESSANRRLPVRVASPSAAASPRPRLRIVSIIPGIETAAPERTETSSGSSGSPNRLPVFSSSRATCPATSSSSPSGSSPLGHVRAAGVGRDREPGRDGQAHQRHLGEPDPLAAEQLTAAVGRLVEVVDVASGHGADSSDARDFGSDKDRAADSPPRAELREPRERAQAEPERREQAVEDDQGDAEGGVPEGPAPAGDRRLRLQRADRSLTLTAALYIMRRAGPRSRHAAP